MRPRSALGVLALYALAWPAFVAAEDAGRPRHILLIYAESRLLPAVVDADAAFRATVSAGSSAPVVFHTEFLDLPPTRSATYERRQRDLLRVKYRDLHVDLVMAAAPRALQAALDYRADLSPTAPIVFLAVDTADRLALPPDVTGVLLTLDWMDTLESALRLQPGTRSVVVVAGTSAIDKRFLAAAR